MENEEQFTVTVEGTQYPVSAVPGDNPKSDGVDFKVSLPEGEFILYLDHTGTLPRWNSTSEISRVRIQLIGEAIEEYYT